MGKARPVVVELEPPDRKLLVDLARHLQVPRVQIMRWALRYYVLRGPWAAPGDDFHSKLMHEAMGLVVGPQLGRDAS